MARFDPRDFGAKADGVSNAAAIQAAIDACTANGGGTVLLSGGTFLTGTIRLKSDVTLEVDGSATLLASPDITDYAEDVHHNRYRNEPELDRCLIYAEDAHDVALVGRGRIAVPLDGGEILDAPESCVL